MGGWGRLALQAGALWIAAACARAAPPAPAPPAGEVVPRHWDQVCDATRTRAGGLVVSELFDTVGLASVLGRAVQPRPLTPPWPLYDFIVRYDARGAAVASGTWDATVDSAVASSLEHELRSRIRALPGLLEPTGFRAQAVFGRRTTFGLAGPVECIPHMVHLPGERPAGLPAHVRTWGGSTYVAEGDTTTAVVRIHVAADGRVARVEAVRGSPVVVDRTRAVVARLRFDAALRNGVPVAGELLQAFRFGSAASGTRGPRSLEVTMVGNAGVTLSDGITSLLVDLPYESGAFGYMTYDPSELKPRGEVASVITHDHLDHFDEALLASRGEWRVLGPRSVLSRLPFERWVWGDSVRIGAFDVVTIATPHTDDHRSYRIRWGGNVFHFTGDTEDPRHLQASPPIDVLFITPWLSCAAVREGLLDVARRSVAYHLSPDGADTVCGDVRVPEQGSTFSVGAR